MTDQNPGLWATARWLLVLIVFVAVLVVLFPLAVDAMRQLVRLS